MNWCTGWSNNKKNNFVLCDNFESLVLNFFTGVQPTSMKQKSLDETKPEHLLIQTSRYVIQ